MTMISEDRQHALSAASQAFQNRGIDIACPWDGDLDDLERERFDAMVAAIDAYNELASPPSGEAGEVTDLADLQLLMHLKDDNVWDGARPVVESNFEQCFRLSEAGLIALEQVARGVRLHITRLGMKAISRALPTIKEPTDE
jgi:hypothetical protein